MTVVIAEIIVSYFYPNIGGFKEPSFTMYLDDTVWPNNTAIDWGNELEAGLSYEFNFTVVNTGGRTLTVSMITYGLPLDWTLTWTPSNNTVLNPGQSTNSSLILSIPSDATAWGTWGFYLRGAE